MTVRRDELEARFKPLRPAQRPRLILAAVFGPLAWLVALAIVSVLISFSRAIVLGFLVTLASLLIAAIVLVVLRRRRDSEERRFVGSA